jgi:dihydropteroate synthase
MAMETAGVSETFRIPWSGGVLELGRRPLVMGILNVTPDSFSDGGRYRNPDEAIARGLRMAEEGADIVDVGGESTRPGADPVGVEEERDRILPVVESLARWLSIPVSIDTRHAEVAREALDAGAALVNDVAGLARDEAMLALVAERKAPVVLMHMRGDPSTMRSRAEYRDVMGEIVSELSAALSDAVARGVSREQIVVDPGIGFSKEAPASFEILRRLPELRALGRPILVGPSRKSFLGSLTGAPPEGRLPATIAAVTIAALQGAHILRVHDVEETVAAIRVAGAVLGTGPAGMLP